MQLPVVLTIAGSDSGGGAGIQADLRAFARFGVWGTSAITAITAQNTRTINAVASIAADSVRAQLCALASDMNIAAVKIGMLGNAANVAVVADFLRRESIRHVVLDPVMLATSGQRLLDRDALDVLRRQLIPLASVLTPNMPEALCLLGEVADAPILPGELAARLLGLGPGAVVLKGAHRDGDIIHDEYRDAGQSVIFAHRRLALEGHGTGCRLSAALAAGLAHGSGPVAATRHAIAYVQEGLAAALYPGKGSAVLGPLGARWPD